MVCSQVGVGRVLALGRNGAVSKDFGFVTSPVGRGGRPEISFGQAAIAIEVLGTATIAPGLVTLGVLICLASRYAEVNCGVAVTMRPATTATTVRQKGQRRQRETVADSLGVSSGLIGRAAEREMAARSGCKIGAPEALLMQVPSCNVMPRTREMVVHFKGLLEMTGSREINSVGVVVLRSVSAVGSRTDKLVVAVKTVVATIEMRSDGLVDGGSLTIATSVVGKRRDAVMEGRCLSKVTT